MPNGHSFETQYAIRKLVCGDNTRMFQKVWKNMSEKKTKKEYICL